MPEHSQASPYEFDINFSVRYGEIGENGVATLSSLGNWLQESAGRNADLLGFGENDLLRHDLTWVLTRLVLRIDRLPREGENLRIHTWPSTLDHFGHRGYEVYDEQNRLIVSGGSAWSVMSLADRSMAQLPDELVPRYPSAPRPCAPFACRVIPRLRTDTPSKSLLRVRRDDLDINGHVNNTRYLAWILEPLPSESALEKKDGESSMPRLVDITFRAECFPQEELECLCAPSVIPSGAEREIFRHAVSGARLHSIQRLSDGSEVCRALTLWDSPQEENSD
ncbi:acyl-ACP thioesterase domain-containing protein [uncultured Mailhella sp.]|uniref:acyl-[acyl-carrier-protein] thioesterase n=1 Tax=uncultured Mailhella sp. TaxID=1981031 RepID=UPI0025FACFCF|nr:acyl-ACP thioesterase domain-containing protein [uncultured Mailhella sp.]